MRVYYNEIEPAAAHVLRELIKAGHIAPGDVDERSIVDVQPDDLRGYAQCHFFAGAGLWSVALRLAGWDDDRSVWTGSCPCQPFSVAGKGAGKNDERHLWPHFFRLIKACRPAVVLGEQVAGAAGYDWFDGVASDLERENYAARALDIPACSVDAPHIRQRLYWTAVDNTMRGRHWNAQEQICAGRIGVELSGFENENMADAKGWGDCGQNKRARVFPITSECGEGHVSFWADSIILYDSEGKGRRAQPRIPLLAHGVAGRVHALRLAGNSIVPQVAAEVIAALMETLP